MATGNREHVTVLLSVFNGERWLAEQLRSVQAQTASDWTMLVADDGSSDRSIALVREFASGDPRIRVVEFDGNNLGPAASFVRLLAEVEDGLFAFCDQDDVWFPHKLEWSVAELRRAESPIAAVYTDAEVVDEGLRLVAPSALEQRGVWSPPTFGELLINNAAIGATMVGTATLAREAVRILAGEGALMHDWWCALVASYAGELRLLSAPTMAWRRHGATVTGATPGSATGRVERRLEYLAWSQLAASLLHERGPVPVSAAEARAVRSLAGGEVSLRRIAAARRAGVRAWPAARQAGLVSAVAWHRLTGDRG